MRNRIYRKIYEEHHNTKIPNGWHIHHIDGNRNNNDISNLEMLSPDEHAKKHGHISNWIMSQKKAADLAIQKLKTPEMRNKMRQSMLNSESHKAFLERRKTDEEWKKNVSEAARKTAKNRTNDPWNKGLTGAIQVTDKTKELMSSQRIGRRWYNDGTKSYFIYPENALSHYKLGRK